MTAADQLKACLRIEDVIGAYVKLRRQGKGPRYFGPCPFHEDKTPSFTVHAERGFWKCFGCGEGGGDFLSFVQKAERASFPDTLRIIAERHGIQLSAPDRPIVAAPPPDEESLAMADLFLTGFRWRLEEYLAALKDLALLGPDPDPVDVEFAPKIQLVTSLLSTLQRVSAADAAKLCAQIDPHYVRRCQASPRRFQSVLAWFLVQLGDEPGKRTAA